MTWYGFSMNDVTIIVVHDKYITVTCGEPDGIVLYFIYNDLTSGCNACCLKGTCLYGW